MNAVSFGRWLIHAAALSSLACAGGDAASSSPAGAGATSTSSSAEARRFASAYCTMARNCCGAAHFAPASLDDCDAEVVRQIDTLSALATGMAQVREPAFTECIATLTQLGETCTYPSTPSTACAQAILGNVPAMGHCSHVSECSRGDDPVVCFDGNSDDTELGICAPLPRANLGDGCVDTATANYFGFTYSTSPSFTPSLAVCYQSDGLFCSFGTRTCQPLSEPNGPCSESEACPASYTCEQGSCLLEKQLGEACTDDCRRGLQCSNGVCSAIAVAQEKLCSGDFN
ncbi:MAG TPA: hypothetical protein VHO25_11775 [Polyangiaceae bacterium]|nr:hypothetical protein [Polyangiaceae bacterium]